MRIQCIDVGDDAAMSHEVLFDHELLSQKCALYISFRYDIHSLTNEFDLLSDNALSRPLLSCGIHQASYIPSIYSLWYEWNLRWNRTRKPCVFVDQLRNCFSFVSMIAHLRMNR